MDLSDDHFGCFDAHLLVVIYDNDIDLAALVDHLLFNTYPAT